MEFQSNNFTHKMNKSQLMLRQRNWVKEKGGNSKEKKGKFKRPKKKKKKRNHFPFPFSSVRVRECVRVLDRECRERERSGEERRNPSCPVWWAMSSALRACRFLLAPSKSGVSSAAKAMTKAKVEAKTSRQPGGLQKLVPVSPTLASFVGSSQCTRAEAVKQVWAHIKRHNLQVPHFISLLLLLLLNF